MSRSLTALRAIIAPVLFVFITHSTNVTKWRD
jgi:hypothetical protein